MLSWAIGVLQAHRRDLPLHGEGSSGTDLEDQSDAVRSAERPPWNGGVH
ncbi:hypothetical protein [Micromonospora chersina]